MHNIPLGRNYKLQVVITMENSIDNSQRSVTVGLVTTEHRNQHGTVTKLRSIQRNTDGAGQSTARSSVKIKKRATPENSEPKSYSRASTLTSPCSGKDEIKALLPSGKKTCRPKVASGRASGREEVRQSRQQQVCSSQVCKPKTPRPSKVPQLYKPKGDGTKVTDKHYQSKHCETHGRCSTTEEKSTNKSSKVSDKHNTKTEEHAKQSQNSRKKSSKPPQSPSEFDVKMTAKVLKTRGYLLEGKLGEGTYAKVRRAYSYHHNCRVAIKIVSRSRLNTRFKQKFLPRELRIVRSIRHPNIIELLEMFEINGVIFLIMELARHGDLLEYVQKKHALRDSEARAVFTQIISAVEYLHTNGIYHRDLKCENILLDWGPTGITAKLSDFGFAREWNEAFKPCSTFCGSAAYASPEILQAIPYDPYWADIWSLGVVLYIMITGRMPFDDSNIREALEDMHHNRLNFSRRRLVCIEVQRLLRTILTYEPKQRPSTQSIRSSAWMRGRCTMPHPSAIKSSSSAGGGI
ncbi:testis-specific serine/threonine-protein kinase 3-like [Diadema setosum]|uniref:testis-specific serine/threonine-protein kinase 3-like n=1 Tax=Diadema setosum TaxID=31175 RepID=UPI003B3BBCF2